MPQRYSYVKPGRTDSILLPTAYGKHLDNVSSKELDESIEVEADIIPPLASTGSEARSDIDATEDLVKDDERDDDDDDVDADIDHESVDEIAQVNFLQDLVEAKGEEYLTAIDTIEDNVAVEDEQEENDDVVSDINNDIIVKHDVVEVTDAESPMEIDTINVTVDDEQVNDVVVVDINNEPVAEAQEDEDQEDEAQEDVDVQSDVEVKDKEEECSNMEDIHDVECVNQDGNVVVAAEDIEEECVIKAQENVVVEVTDNEVKDSNDACVTDVGVIEVTDKEVKDSNDTCVIKNQEIVQFQSVVEVTDKEVKVSNDACVKDVDVDSKNDVDNNTDVDSNTDLDSNTDVDISTDVDTNTDSGIIDVDTQEEASDLEVRDEKEEVGEISCDSNDVNANKNNEESLIKANKELMGTVNELMTTVEYLKAMIDIQQLSDNSKPFDRIRMLEDDVTVKSATIDLLTDKIVSLDEKIQQISMLEEELTVTRAAIDEMAVDINRTITSFEEKTAENADLAKQLQLSKSKNEELEAEVQTMAHKYEAAKLVTAKNFPTFAEIESRKAEVESLTASNKECVEKVTMLETALAAKKCTIDDLIAEMNRKNKKLQEKSDEISDINERLEIIKAKNKGLEAEHPILVDKIKVFESDLAAKKVVVDDLSIVIQQKNTLLEEKSAEIADISNQLQIYKDVCDEFTTKVESLVADNNEHIENISKLNEDLAAKTNLIEELRVETEQNAALKEKLQDAQAENDGLKKAVEALIASSKENIQQISFLESDLATKSSTIDSINEDLQNKNASLEEKSVEIVDLTNQLQLSKAELKAINEETVKRVSTLQDEVAAKQVTIHTLNLEIKDLNSTCMKMATEQVASDEKFALSQAQNDELKTTVQNLESKNSKYFAEIHTLTSSLQEKVEQNEALQLRVEEVSVSADNTIAANNTANKEKIAEIKVQIEEVSAANDKLSKINNTFESRNSELMVLLESMTKDGKAERFEFEKTIEDMSEKIESLTSTSEKLTSENNALTEQLELFKLKSNSFKTAVQELESKNNNFSTEVERLTASLIETNTSNEALQVQVKDLTTANAELSQTCKKSKKAIGKLQDALKSMTRQLNDEKTNTDKQLDDMKQLMEKFVSLSEESLADANAKNVEQRKTIDELCKSLDDAMMEIANKDIILGEKSTEIQKYLDLAAQFKSSDCAVGYGGFWR